MEPHTKDDLFEPMTILPEQFYSSLAGAPLSVRRLMLAVLQDALDCYKEGKNSTSRRGRYMMREAEGWIHAHDDSWPFSFESICASLGLDPSCIRGELFSESRRLGVQKK